MGHLSLDRPKVRPCPTSPMAFTSHWTTWHQKSKDAPLCRLTLYPVYTIQPVVKPVWQPCWTNSHCSFNRLSNRVVYTIQPVVKRVWQPVWQPVVSCIQTFNRLSNQFDNRVHNRLYRVNGALRCPRCTMNGYQHGLGFISWSSWTICIRIINGSNFSQSLMASSAKLQPHSGT